MDSDHSGTISKEEFNEQFSRIVGEDMPLKSTNMLFDIVDTNGNGTIDFSEFKAAVLRSQVFINENALLKAFRFFDRNNSNTIEWFELKAVFESYDDIVSMYDE